MLENDQIIAYAEAVLTHRYGGQQHLTEPEVLSGSGTTVVLRARVATNPFLSHRSVVVKYLPAAGDPLDDAAFVREVVAYQFTTSLSEEVRPGPVLLGHDLDKRVIILSDCGDADTLETLLETSEGDDRVRLLRNLGTSLGKMHAGTAEAEDGFNILLSRMVGSIEDARETQALREGMLENRILEGVEILRRAGLAVPAEIEETAETVQLRLFRGGTRAFTPFDLSPDNIIYAERTQFLDYEWAGFRDVVFDLAGIIAGFPQHLSTRPISDEEAKVLVDAWAAEVSDTWPSLLEAETLHKRIVAALLGWAFFSVSILYLEGEETDQGTRYGGGWVVGRTNTHEVVRDPSIHNDDVERGAFILRARDQRGFTSAEKAIRRDVRDTFEALHRYVSALPEPDHADIGEFAEAVMEHLR